MTMEHGRATERSGEHYPLDDTFLEFIAQLPSGKPETFGATPLDFPGTHEQQQALQESLRQLVQDSVLDGVPESVSNYMLDTFVRRFTSRGIANYENFCSSLRDVEDFGEHGPARELLERAKAGHATPAELLVARDMLGIRSIELACLSHPYGAHIELLDTMRQAVQENAIALDGVWDDTPEVRYRVKGFAGEFHDYSEGILMTRKRTLGMMPDGTIIRERSSFILRCDSKSAVTRKMLRAINREVGTMTKDSHMSLEWQDKAVEAAQLDELVTQLLAENQFAFAIPISSTIYAYNEATTEAIKQRDEARKQERKEAHVVEMQERYPELYKAFTEAEKQRKAREEGREIKNVGGMFFSGSWFEDDDE